MLNRDTEEAYILQCEVAKDLFFKCGWKATVAQLGHSQETEVFLHPLPYFTPSSMVDYANAIQQKFLQAEEDDASQEPDNNA